MRRASLVAQWLRICLPMQGTWVPSLAWEDPTCLGATKAVGHNYEACALEPVSHDYGAPAHRASRCSPTSKVRAVRSLNTTTKSSPCWRQPDKPARRNKDPAQSKTNKYKEENTKKTQKNTKKKNTKRRFNSYNDSGGHN